MKPYMRFLWAEEELRELAPGWPQQPTYGQVGTSHGSVELDVVDHLNQCPVIQVLDQRKQYDD